MENLKNLVNPIIDEIATVDKAVLESLKDLKSSDPEDVHPTLLKSGTEARKLLYEKMVRAVSDMRRPTEFSKESLSSFDEKLSKAINLTTDAMITHGRYVRSVFSQKSSIVESRLRELHNLALKLHNSANNAMKEISSLDSIITEIDAQTQLVSGRNKIDDDIKYIKIRHEKIKGLVNEETDRLKELRSSEEFKNASDSREKLKQVRQDTHKAKGTAMSHISEMSRPFRKVEKLVLSGKHSIESDLNRILKICINNPAEVITSDENIASLEKLLKETSNLIGQEKIDLNTRERRKKLDAAQRLADELRIIKKTLVNLKDQLEIQRNATENPIFGREVKLEESIKLQQNELVEVQFSIEELDKNSKKMDKEVSSKRKNLEKLASDVMGMKVELTS